MSTTEIREHEVELRTKAADSVEKRIQNMEASYFDTARELERIDEEIEQANEVVNAATHSGHLTPELVEQWETCADNFDESEYAAQLASYSPEVQTILNAVYRRRTLQASRSPWAAWMNFYRRAAQHAKGKHRIWKFETQVGLRELEKVKRQESEESTRFEENVVKLRAAAYAEKRKELLQRGVQRTPAAPQLEVPHAGDVQLTEAEKDVLGQLEF